jgi:hypothetical protein
LPVKSDRWGQHQGKGWRLDGKIRLSSMLDSSIVCGAEVFSEIFDLYHIIITLYCSMSKLYLELAPSVSMERLRHGMRFSFPGYARKGSGLEKLFLKGRMFKFGEDCPFSCFVENRWQRGFPNFTKRSNLSSAFSAIHRLSKKKRVISIFCKGLDGSGKRKIYLARRSNAPW